MTRPPRHRRTTRSSPPLLLAVLLAVPMACGKPAGTPPPPPAPAVGARPAELPSGSAAIRGTVRLDGAPCEAFVRARRVHNPDVSRAGSLAWEWTWDAALATLEQPGLAGDELWETQTTNGAFVFGKLPEGTYRVTALGRAEGRRGSDVTIALAGGPPTRIVLDVAAGHGLRGTVRDAGGEPFVGWIGIVDGDAEGVSAPRLAQDWVRTRDGTFAFRNLPLERAKLVALEPGHAFAASAPLHLPRDNEWTWTLPETGSTWSGRVLAGRDDAPIAGATVLAFSSTGHESLLVTRVLSGPDGRFAAPAPGHATYLWANAPGMLPSEVTDPEDTRDVTVRLARSGTAEGRVLDADGKAVAGVDVYSTVPNDAPVTAAPSRATTDAEGRYRMTGLGPGEVSLFALGSGWITPGLAAIRDVFYDPLAIDPGPGGTLDNDIAAEPSGRIEGRLLDTAGAPIAGATIAVIGSSWTGVILAVTDDEGRFECEDLHPGARCWLRAEPAGRPAAWSDKLTVARGATLRTELRVPDHRPVRVRVVDAESGDPVPHARVTVETPATSGRASTPRPWRTGADGRCTVPAVPVGSFDVVVAAPGHVERRVPGSDDVSVRLARGLSLSGTVRVPADVALDWLEVTATRAPPGYEADAARRADFELSAGARLEGPERTRFAVDGLLPGRYVITASARAGGRWLDAEAHAEAGDPNVVLPLTRETRSVPRNLLLRVAGADGTPVARYRVRAVRSWIVVSELTVTNDVVSLDGVAGDRGSLEVFEARDGEGRLLPLGVGRAPGLRSGSIEVRLPAERTIRGRLVDTDGDPVAGVRVVAAPDAERRDRRALRRERAHGRARSGRDGRFRIGGLGTGRYTLEPLFPPGYARRGLPSVEAGAPEVRIEVARTRPIKVTVIDDDGAPVAGCVINEDPRIRTDEAGVAHVPPTPPRTRPGLTVRAPADRPELRGTSHRGRLGREVTVQLRAAPLIEGRVIDRRGEPAHAGFVAHADSTTRWAEIGAGGRFTLREWQKGSDLTVVVPNTANRSPRVVTHGLRAGPERFNDLVVDLGGRLRFRVADWDEAWTRLPVPVLASLTREGGPVGDAGGHVLTVGDGSFAFLGLDGEARYELRIGGVGRAAGAVLTGLVPGPAEHEIRLAPAGRLEVAIEGWLGDHSDVLVTVTGEDTYLRGAPDEEGRLHLHALPLGACEVRAEAVLSGRPYAASRTIDTAETHRVILELTSR